MIHLQPLFFWSWLRLSSSRYPDPPSADREDIDTVIEEVVKDDAAEAEKIATEEAAKDAAEDAAKGPAGEPGKAEEIECLGKFEISNSDRCCIAGQLSSGSLS